MTAIRGIGFLCLMMIVCSYLKAQTNADTCIRPDYLKSIHQRSTNLSTKLDRKTKKLLASIQKIEARIYRKLNKTDSAAASKIFEGAAYRYQQLGGQIASTGSSYIARLDTFATSLQFLQRNPNVLAGIIDANGKLNAALLSVRQLKQQFAKAEFIKKFTAERKAYLKEQLSKFGFAKELKQLSKQSYYYSQQIREYKEALKDSKKAEAKAIQLLSQTKLFKDFMRRNSELSSLFRMPGDPSDPTAQANVAGLQTRAQVNSLVQQQIAAGGTGAAQQVSQNMQAAQSQLNQLKDKVLKAGGHSTDDDLPEFKPNNQKTRSFWSRLELGANMQTQKATSFFPNTSDIGMSVGYKLNDKSIIGFGASYKIGLGTGWRNISITNQGLGLRTYIDFKLKGSFWISGGYEQNYRAAFNSIEQLRDLKAWQQSGLIGVSKVISVKTKFFKKTKLQLLWDMLSYQQTPRTKPLLFRVGYNF